MSESAFYYNRNIELLLLLSDDPEFSPLNVKSTNIVMDRNHNGSIFLFALHNVYYINKLQAHVTSGEEMYSVWARGHFTSERKYFRQALSLCGFISQRGLWPILDPTETRREHSHVDQGERERHDEDKR